MKTLALLSLSLAVALGMPPLAQDVAQNPVLTEENQSLVKGDWVPVQGHVVVEEPAPQIKPSSQEQQEKLAPVPVDMKPSVVELESKVEPQVEEKQGGEVKTEDKPKPEVKVEPVVKVEPEAKVEPEVKAEPEVEVEPEVMAEFKVDMKPEVEMEPELQDDPNFMVESEVKVEPDVLEVFQRRMNLEAETETSQDIEERHIDMEEEYEMVEPIMDLEPMDDDDDTELSEVEKSMRAAFQNQVPVNQPLPEEEGGLMRERTYVLNEEPIMELEPLDDDNVPAEKLSNSVLSGAKGNPEMVGEPIMELVPPDDDNMPAEKLSNSVLSGAKGNPEMVGEPIMELVPPDDDNMPAEKLSNSVLSGAKGNPEMVGEPIMELVPPDDDNMPAEKLSNSVLSGAKGNPEMVGEPIMELVPPDDDNMPAEKLSNSVLSAVRGNPEMVGEPIMELVPPEGDDSELSEVEKSMRASFQNQDPVYQPLPEEEGLVKERMYVLNEEPVEGLIIPDAALMDEGPALDSLGQPMLPLEEYYPNEEARVWMGQDEQQNSRMMKEPDYVMMEEPGRESVREEELFEEPAMEGGPVH